MAGHETLDGVFETNLDIEEATEAETLILLLFDYRKFFDFIVQELRWGLAKWWGIPQGIVKRLKSFYTELTSVFKINGHFGKPWKRTNSLAQGCSLSMMLVNLQVTAWARATLHKVSSGQAGISAYVDDKVLRSRSFTVLQILLGRTVKFDRYTGQYLSLDKSWDFAQTGVWKRNLNNLMLKEHRSSL